MFITSISDASLHKVAMMSSSFNWYIEWDAVGDSNIFFSLNTSSFFAWSLKNANKNCLGARMAWWQKEVARVAVRIFQSLTKLTLMNYLFWWFLFHNQPHVHVLCFTSQLLSYSTECFSRVIRVNLLPDCTVKVLSIDYRSKYETAAASRKLSNCVTPKNSFRFVDEFWCRENK